MTELQIKKFHNPKLTDAQNELVRNAMRIIEAAKPGHAKRTK